jgi:hypothetical protein
MAAQLPTSKPAPVVKPDETKVETPKVAPVLSFTAVSALPDAKEISQVTNPFQPEVNRLHKEGGASMVEIAKDDEKWARDMIRRAIGSIKMGAKTKVVPIPEGEKNHGTHVRVYFAVGPKSERASK